MDAAVPGAPRAPNDRHMWRTAKSCGPGTPGLVLSLAEMIREATVTNKVMDTGASTSISVNTIAQGMSVQRLTCSDYASVLFTFAHWAMGVAETPGIPCALCFA